MHNTWRQEDVIDNFHGTPVADPYRWLENGDDPATRVFIEAQNEGAFSYLRHLPVRSDLHRRLQALWNFPKNGTPGKAGQQYYWLKNSGLQNQSVLYLQETLDARAPARALIDPNTLREDGTAALSSFSFCRDGRYVAYSVSESGSDWQQIQVRDTETGEDLTDVIRFCKFTQAAWTVDGRGFYYSRFPEPGTVPPEDSSNFCQVYWHTLHTAQTQDELVYERPDAKELGFQPILTEDGKYLVLIVTTGTATETCIYYRDVNSNGSFTRLLDDFDARYDPIGSRGDTFYFLTDANASNGRIIAIDLKQPNPTRWRTIVPEQGVVIEAAQIAGDQLVLRNMRDAHHELKVFGLDGTESHDIPLPALGAVTNWFARDGHNELFVTFTSFLHPPTVLRHNLETQETTTLFQPELPIDLSVYETTQVFYSSKDGTQIPMFLTHRKGLKLDGSNPTLLTGYGGFHLSRTPDFSVPPLLLLERGGVFALANLRGGGEYGDAWHRAGMLEKKQNVFDDFIAAAEFLCEAGYTRTSKLAITGRSNGGLLVSACMLQRPDLFGAVICGVPVADMLRYHRFTVGRYWVPEYGNAQTDPEQFRFMYAYSPLHNVQAGATYPPILIHTGDTDDRVVPAHPFKLAATLQANAASADTVWLRVDTHAGHGHGKPLAKLIDEEADLYAFLFDQLGVE